MAPRRWDDYDVVGPGTVDLFFTGSPHHVLAQIDRVEVEERPDAVLATLYLGNAPDARGAYTLVGMPCAVRVELPWPLAGRPVVDGWAVAVADSRLALWRSHVEKVEVGRAEPGLDDAALSRRDELEEALTLSTGPEGQRLRAELAALDERFSQATVPVHGARGEGSWWWARQPAVSDHRPEMAQRNVTAAVRYGKEEAPGEYGGVYLSGDTPVACVVCFTGHLENHLVRLRHLVPHPETLQVRAVPFTEAELDETREQLGGVLVGSGSYMFGTTLGPNGFVVRVDLPRGSEAIAAELFERFGARVEVDVCL